MTNANYPIAVPLSAAREAAVPAGKRFAEPFRHVTMRLLHYAPQGREHQTPHAQDELYVVAAGEGTFFRGGRRTHILAGEVLFTPEGVERRFENFSEDFAVWVIFYRPHGGEKEERIDGACGNGDGWHERHRQSDCARSAR